MSSRTRRNRQFQPVVFALNRKRITVSVRLRQHLNHSGRIGDLHPRWLEPHDALDLANGSAWGDPQRCQLAPVFLNARRADDELAMRQHAAVTSLGDSCDFAIRPEDLI